MLACPSGIAGNLFLAAMIRLGAPIEEVATVGHRLGVGAQITMRRRSHQRFPAFDVAVTGVDPSVRGTYADLQDRVRGAGLDPWDADAALHVLARRESTRAAVRGVEVSDLTYVGEDLVDTLVDVVGGILAWSLIGNPRLTVWGPVVTGAGVQQESLDCLAALPTVAGTSQLELATPTGAALLGVLAERAPMTSPPPPSADARIAGTFAIRDDLPPLLGAWLD